MQRHSHPATKSIALTAPPLPLPLPLPLLLQVPKVTAEVLCPLVSRFDGAGMALVDVLATFLDAASDEGFLGSQHAPSRLAGSIPQQLESAGLCSHLGTVFDQASKQLKATTPTVAVLRELRDRPEDERGSTAKQAMLTVVQFAQQSLLLYRRMQHLWKLEHLPGSWLPSLDAAAMGLAATTVSCISRWVEQLPAPAGAARVREQQGPWLMLAVVLDVACVVVTECARRRALEQASAQRARWWLGLTSTCEYLWALSSALFYYVHANLTREGSSKQASSKQQQQGHELNNPQAWAAACQEAAALTPKQQQLLQTLGCVAAGLCCGPTWRPMKWANPRLSSCCLLCCKHTVRSWMQTGRACLAACRALCGPQKCCVRPTRCTSHCWAAAPLCSLPATAGWVPRSALPAYMRCGKGSPAGRDPGARAAAAGQHAPPAGRTHFRQPACRPTVSEEPFRRHD